MFLTPKEVEHLTGYVRAAEQIRWLRATGIVHWVNGRGQPVVPCDAVCARPGSAPAEAVGLGVVP
jgi:hypothetical protein